MVPKKVLVLKMAVTALMLFLLLAVSATARADSMVEFMKKITSKNHELSQYKSEACCHNCACLAIGTVKECKCGDMYEGEEGCNKLSETCKSVHAVHNWPIMCVCDDIKDSCNSCSTTTGAGADAVAVGGIVSEAYIIDQAT